MIFNFEDIIREVKKKDPEKKPEETVPPVKPDIINIDDEVNSELKEPRNQQQTEDAQFMTKCYKYLRRLGYCQNQYQYSEQFLNKNKYYYAMILSEQRHPSVDSIHNLIHNISELNDGLTKHLYLDSLYEEGQSLITKRLLRYL